MKRTTAAVLTALMMLVLAVPAFAQAGPPVHGHILLLGLEFDAGGEPVGYRKCVNIANNNALRLQAHHHTIHQGRAGEALWNAGNAVVPTHPLIPGVHNCADFARALAEGAI